MRRTAVTAAAITGVAAFAIGAAALTPNAAAKMCTKQPAVMPSPATTPALAPERSELVTM